MLVGNDGENQLAVIFTKALQWTYSRSSEAYME